MVILALIPAALGISITGINIYLVLLRQPLHLLRHGKDPSNNVSVVPILGSLFLWIAAALCWWVQQLHWAHGLLFLSLFDMGGLHWFLIYLLLGWIQQAKEN